MKLICNRSHHYHRKRITVGREYEVLDDLGDHYKIKDDKGEASIFPKEWFDYEASRRPSHLSL